MNSFGKRLTALGLSVVLVSLPALAETSMTQALKDGFATNAKDILAMNIDYTGMYKDAKWTDESKTFPASYGIAVPEPVQLNDYSGQFKLRIPKSLHLELALQSAREGISMNQYCVYLLSRGSVRHG